MVDNEQLRAMLCQAQQDIKCVSEKIDSLDLKVQAVCREDVMARKSICAINKELNALIRKVDKQD